MARKINPVQVLADYQQLEINVDKIVVYLRGNLSHVDILSYFYVVLDELDGNGDLHDRIRVRDDGSVAIADVHYAGKHEFPLFVPADLLSDPTNDNLYKFRKSFEMKVMDQVERVEYKDLSNFYNRERDKINRYSELKKKFGE